MNENHTKTQKKSYIKCTKCNKAAIIFQKYSGMHLCKNHFIADVERKIKLTIRKDFKVHKNETIAIALSGGKDSTVLCYILDKIFGKRPDIKLIAITIDEGIAGYRERSLELAKNLTKQLKMKHIIKPFEDEFDITLDELTKKERTKGACSYCGVLRKNLLNKTANKIKASKLATGHNLDDEAQTILLNHLRGDVARTLRLSPKKAIKGLVFRAKPLKNIPEKEVALYAYVNNLPIDFSECPYAHESIRNEVRDMINNFEINHPGTKHALLKSLQKMIELVSDAQDMPNEIDTCTICNEACTNNICKACQLLKKDKKHYAI